MMASQRVADRCIVANTPCIRRLVPGQLRNRLLMKPIRGVVVFIILILWGIRVGSQGKNVFSVDISALIRPDSVGEGSLDPLRVDELKIQVGKVRKIRVAGKRVVKDGEDQQVGVIYSLMIQLFTTDIEQLRRILAKGIGLRQRVDNLAARGLVGRVATHHDIATTWQGAADGFMGFAAHDQGMAPGYLPEPFLFSLNLPGNRIVTAYNPVLRHGRDEDDFHGR